MVFKPEKMIGAALVASLAAASVAHAGGFARGTADTDILYEDGNFAARAGVAYTMPQRGYETINGESTNDGDYLDSYAVPSAAAKFNITDDLRCAGTYTQPFGAKATYGPDAIQAGLYGTGQGTEYSDFITNEIGLTCGYKFKVGPGNLWLLGGGFVEDISYEEGTYVFANNPALLTVLDLHEDYKPGFRLGAAFEVPEIALRVQAMYRSEVKHNLDGTFTVAPALGNQDFLDTIASDLTPLYTNPDAVGAATLPQSFEIRAQSGVAPGWLVFGSIKWTDWSAFDVLSYTSAIAAVPAVGPVIESEKEFYWKDNWTYSLGVGHKFNDMISGSLSLTYDEGVSTTEDVTKDTITLAGGLQFTVSEMAKIGVGGAISHLQGGSVAAGATCNATPAPTPDCDAGEGNKFAYTLGDDWAYTIGANLLVKF
tara:strand:- start:195 stop:1472 length:1278 start_codon:yes stop_codon:yes gene_type:complete